MADDIVDRLQDTAYEIDVCWEAAAEIERLRAVIAAIDKIDMHVVDLAFKQVEAQNV